MEVAFKKVDEIITHFRQKKLAVASVNILNRLIGDNGVQQQALSEQHEINGFS